MVKGVAVLTEGRSGSSWLGSLTNATGIMGCSGEWLKSAYLGLEPRRYDVLEETVIRKSATENGRFAIKVFPRHLIWSKGKCGKDFLLEIRRNNDLGFILLERRDRLRQAISFYRASASRLWSIRHKGAGTPVEYSFAGISRAFFQIEQSYAFWRAYLNLSQLPYRQFVYEDLQPDPRPYVEAVAQLLDVPVPATVPVSPYAIQRDDLTEDWAKRFRQEAAEKGAIEAIEDEQVPRTLDNLARFATKRSLTRRRF
ncbi:Stf0 family sulfotransferase [Mesorhizobium sp. VK24D]|uniref:Stf0 family sulfotransferase n=1 Tax=Mesorhizobium album TaxID=3072314 RepID=A0ABU4Y6Y7_9HYPH|nr:Stf0 family sulfotransferase [Mesorhizobium sp. VK24D]MDX8482696.1 Stf0 family sulfotransferase [Mesorhizobium sp. VK24D]